MTSGKKATSGKAWRQQVEGGEFITLPSGKTVKLRAVSLERFLLSGVIPNLLAPLAAKTLWEETPVESIGQDVKNLSSYIELIEIIVPAAMMEPVVVLKTPENPVPILADNEILLDHMDFVDKIAVFQLAIQGADA